MSTTAQVSAWIVGAGAQGRVVLDAWRLQHPERDFGFLDDSRDLWGIQVLGALVRGGTDLLSSESGDALLALGNNQLRAALAQSLSPTLSGRWGTLVHPRAFVSPSASLAPGVVVLAGAIVNTGACIEAHAIVNTGAIVEHDCVVGAFASVSPGAKMGGRVAIGRGAFISTGASLCPRVRVGDGSVVGAGAVVTRDVPAGVLAVGVPARVVRELDDTFDWRRLL